MQGFFVGGKPAILASYFVIKAFLFLDVLTTYACGQKRLAASSLAKLAGL